MITVYSYAIEILITNRTDSLQYTALIAAYKAYPLYGARTRYLSLSTPVVIQCAIEPPKGGTLSRVQSKPAQLEKLNNITQTHEKHSNRLFYSNNNKPNLCAYGQEQQHIKNLHYTKLQPKSLMKPK